MLLNVAFGVFLILVGAYGLYMAQVIKGEEDRASGTLTAQRIREIGWRFDPVPVSRSRRLVDTALSIAIAASGGWWILSHVT